MFLYQQTQRFFVQIAGGFDEVARDDLAELGAREIKPAYRGMHVAADLTTLYRMNYEARTVVRVLAPLAGFNCHSDRYLYRRARRLDWSALMNPDRTFAVQAITADTPGLKNSNYAALKVKDALCDYFRDETGRRPRVDARNPDVGIHLFVKNNHATISLDTSGGSLHKRGYRIARVQAPMAETLAAAAIRLSGWDGEQPLVDLMCGSGTLLCEAAMHYSRIPAGILRQRWGFESLPDFDPRAWKKVKKRADDAMRPLPPGLIRGSDLDPEAVSAARNNFDRLPGCRDRASWEVCDFRSIERIRDSLIVVNPPYGVRLGDREDAEQRMKELGDFLKQRCTGCTALIYAGDRQLLKKVGLKPDWKADLNNGGLKGVLGKYGIY